MSEADGSSPAVPARSSAARAWLVRAGALLVGAFALALVVRFAGVDDVKRALLGSLRWLPLLFVLEALRIPLEIRVTTRLLGREARDAAPGLLVRVHLLFYALSIVAPGGRVVAEAAKATLLGTRFGGARAAAASATSLSSSFCADACVGLAGTVAVYAHSGATPVSLSLFVFAGGAVALAALVQWLPRREPPRFLARFSRLSQRLVQFREAARKGPLFVPGAIAPLVLARASQLGFFYAALRALGTEPELLDALGLLALAMLASAVGDAVPAQLGATDAVFVASAAVLGQSAVTMASLAVLFHLVQLGLVSACALAAAFWPWRSPECRIGVEQTTYARATMDE